MTNPDSGSYSLHMAEQEEIYRQKIRVLEIQLHWAKLLLDMIQDFYSDRISTVLLDEIKEFLKNKL